MKELFPSNDDSDNDDINKNHQNVTLLGSTNDHKDNIKLPETLIGFENIQETKIDDDDNKQNQNITFCYIINK